MSIVRYDTRMREASHLPPKASSLGQFLFFRPVFTVIGLILMKWNFRSYICYIHKVYNNATSIYTFLLRPARQSNKILHHIHIFLRNYIWNNI